MRNEDWKTIGIIGVLTCLFTMLIVFSFTTLVGPDLPPAAALPYGTPADTTGLLYVGNLGWVDASGNVVSLAIETLLDGSCIYHHEDGSTEPFDKGTCDRIIEVPTAVQGVTAELVGDACIYTNEDGIVEELTASECEQPELDMDAYYQDAGIE